MKIISDPRLHPDEVNVLVDDQVREEAKWGKEIDCYKKDINF